MKRHTAVMFCFWICGALMANCHNVHCCFEYLGCRGVRDFTKDDFMKTSAASANADRYFEKEHAPFKDLDWNLLLLEESVKMRGQIPRNPFFKGPAGSPLRSQICLYGSCVAGFLGSVANDLCVSGSSLTDACSWFAAIMSGSMGCTSAHFADVGGWKEKVILFVLGGDVASWSSVCGDY